MEKGAPMQIAKNRVAAIAATVCMIVACALTLTAVTPPAIAVADTHTLTVKAPEGTNLAKDIAAGDVTVSVDVYQVANATYDPMYDMYEYALIDKYAKAEGLQERLDKALKGNGGSEWEKFAKQAHKTASNIEPTTSGTLVGGTSSDGKKTAEITMTGLDAGLYLVVPRDKKELVAVGKKTTYNFSAYVVAIPTKTPDNYDSLGYLDPSKTITSYDSGEWVSDVAIALKPDAKPTPPPSSTKKKPSSSTSSTTRTSVKTGDNFDLLPFYVTMAVSGVLLLLLGAYSLRKRKEENGVQ